MKKKNLYKGLLFEKFTVYEFSKAYYVKGGDSRTNGFIGTSKIDLDNQNHLTKTKTNDNTNTIKIDPVDLTITVTVGDPTVSSIRCIKPEQ